jgi:hypothetical protein
MTATGAALLICPAALLSGARELSVKAERDVVWHVGSGHLAERLGVEHEHERRSALRVEDHRGADSRSLTRVSLPW